MTNTTAIQILTKEGEELLARLAAEEKELIIDTFIFADVPDRPAYPQREDDIPTEYVVHQSPIHEKGRLNANSVIYSSTLASSVGPFYFNWCGLYCSEYDVLVTIHHPQRTPKTADELGVAGNTLVRSQVLQYTGVANITNITVDASSWQYNADPRLKKMDKDAAQAIIDQNGKDWFIEDGFLVLPQSTAFNVLAGAGYVSGHRVTLDFDRIIQIPEIPAYIYLDVYREGSPTGEWISQFHFIVSNEEKDDYTDSQGAEHFVCKIAQIFSDGSVRDLRPESNRVEWVKGEFIQAREGKKGEFPVKKHSETSEVHWVKLTDLIMMHHPALPAFNESPKLVLHQPGGMFQVVTKKARNAPGFVMMTFQKTTAAPDDFNEFGSSHYRPTTVYELDDVIVGRLSVNSTNVVKAGLSTTFNAGVLGVSSLDNIVGYTTHYQDENFPTFSKLQPWNIMGENGYVEYLLNGEFTLLFARSPGSSSQVIIEERQSDGTYIPMHQFSLNFDHNDSGQDAAFIYLGKTSKNKLSAIRVRNEDPLKQCYLYGANIHSLDELKSAKLLVDTAAYVRVSDFRYIKSSGANDFAFHRTDGKWFGSYHGGHRNETLKMFTDNGGSGQHLNGYFELTSRVMFESCTNLYSSGEHEFDVCATTQFVDGGYINHVSIDTVPGQQGVECSDIYTSMTCTNQNFTLLEFPKRVDLSVYPGGKYLLKNNDTVTQLEPASDNRVTSKMTLFTTENNQYGGLRIDKASQYNKVYYGPVLSNDTDEYPSVKLTELAFVAVKEFY